MPNGALGYDADNAAYESLKAKILGDQKKAHDNKDSETANKAHNSESSNQTAQPANRDGRRKSLGEKIANTLFNGGRPDDAEGWGDLKTKIQQRRHEKR